MKLAIVGGRDFKDFDLMEYSIDKHIGLYVTIKKIISGGANGADTLAEDFADKYGIEKKIYYAEWGNLKVELCVVRENHRGKYNVLAGFNRNTKIAEACDKAIAFWDGKSTGTKDTIDKIKELGKEVVIVNY